MPDGNGGRVHAVSNTGNNSTDLVAEVSIPFFPRKTSGTHNHMRDTRGRSLQRRTNNQNRTSHHNHLPPSEPVTEEKGEQRPSETSDFIDGDDGALKRSGAGSGGCGVDFGEFLCESSACEEA